MALVERISSSWVVIGLVIGGMVVEGEEEEVCGVKLKLKLEAGVAYRDISYQRYIRQT
jgi:hypothetical protein